MLPFEELVNEWSARIPSGVINFTDDDFSVLEVILLERDYPLAFIREYINEVKKVLESDASDEAKKKGLKHHHGPWYKDPSTGMVVAKSEDGGKQLVSVTPTDPKDLGSDSDDESQQQQQQPVAKSRKGSVPDVEDRAEQGDVAAQLKVQADEKKKEEKLDAARELGIDDKTLKKITNEKQIQSRIDYMIGRGVDPDFAEEAGREIFDAAASGDVERMKRVAKEYKLQIGLSGGIRTKDKRLGGRAFFGKTSVADSLADAFDASGVLKRPFDKMAMEPDNVFASLENEVEPTLRTNDNGDVKAIAIESFVSTYIDVEDYRKRHPDADDKTIQAIEVNNSLFNAMQSQTKNGQFTGKVIRKGNSEHLVEAVNDTLSQLKIPAERRKQLSTNLLELANVDGDNEDEINRIVSETIKMVDSSADNLMKVRPQLCEIMEIIISTRRNDFTVIPGRGAPGGDVYGLRSDGTAPDITTVDMDDDEVLDLIMSHSKEIELNSVKFLSGGAAGAAFIISVTTYDSLDKRKQIEELTSSDEGSIFNKLWYGDKDEGKKMFRDFVQKNQAEIQKAFLSEYGTDDVDAVLRYAGSGKLPPKVKRGEPYPPPPETTPLWAEGGKCAERADEWRTLGGIVHLSTALHNHWKSSTKLALSKYSKKGRVFSDDLRVQGQTYKTYRPNDCAPDAAISWHQKPA